MPWPWDSRSPAEMGFGLRILPSPALVTPECYYYDFDTIKSITLSETFAPRINAAVCDAPSTTLLLGGPAELEAWPILEITHWTATHWEIPIGFCVLYMLMLVALPRIMADRKPLSLRPLAIAWNFGLSAFSAVGAYHCIPHLLFGPSGLFSHGIYESVCSHPGAYGANIVGRWVGYFALYSKVAELLDTFFLLVRKRPIIVLHWYHHLSVLLFCWHAYSARIGTGLWFATMNYSVHTLMYFYFGLTQCGDAGRKLARKAAIFITTLQLTQMVGGIYVTVAAIYWQWQARRRRRPLPARPPARARPSAPPPERARNQIRGPGAPALCELGRACGAGGGHIAARATARDRTVRREWRRPKARRIATTVPTLRARHAAGPHVLRAAAERAARPRDVCVVLRPLPPALPLPLCVPRHQEEADEHRRRPGLRRHHGREAVAVELAHHVVDAGQAAQGGLAHSLASSRAVRRRRPPPPTIDAQSFTHHRTGSEPRSRTAVAEVFYLLEPLHYLSTL